MAKIADACIVNAFALLVAETLLDGFMLSGGLLHVSGVALTLTILNLFIKPFLKMIFGPFILLTFGLGIVFIHGFLLALLDFLSEDLMIQNIHSLLFGTFIVSGANLIHYLATKS